MRILKREWCGCFGPHQEVRLLSAGGTPQAELLEFRQSGVSRGGIPEQPPGKTDLRQIGAEDLRGNPKEGSAEKSGANSLLRQPLHHPGAKANRTSPDRRDEK